MFSLIAIVVSTLAFVSTAYGDYFEDPQCSPYVNSVDQNVVFNVKLFFAQRYEDFTEISLYGNDTNLISSIMFKQCQETSYGAEFGCIIEGSNHLNFFVNMNIKKFNGAKKIKIIIATKPGVMSQFYTILHKTPVPKVAAFYDYNLEYTPFNKSIDLYEALNIYCLNCKFQSTQSNYIKIYYDDIPAEQPDMTKYEFVNWCTGTVKMSFPMYVDGSYPTHKPSHKQDGDDDNKEEEELYTTDMPMPDGYHGESKQELLAEIKKFQDLIESSIVINSSDISANNSSDKLKKIYAEYQQNLEELDKQYNIVNGDTFFLSEEDKASYLQKSNELYNNYTKMATIIIYKSDDQYLQSKIKDYTETIERLQSYIDYIENIASNGKKPPVKTKELCCCDCSLCFPPDKSFEPTTDHQPTVPEMTTKPTDDDTTTTTKKTSSTTTKKSTTRKTTPTSVTNRRGRTVKL